MNDTETFNLWDNWYYVEPGGVVRPCQSLDDMIRFNGDRDRTKPFEEGGRRVAETRIGPAWVSTVFLGLDHSFGGGPPVLFETMIFGGKHDNETWRYCTVEEARAGHEHAVRVAQGEDQP